MRLLVENLSKEYRGNVRALSEVHLALGPGVLGLLGPNGAGKSTLMRILGTITQPSSGRVLWNDSEIARHPDLFAQSSVICRRILGSTLTSTRWSFWSISLPLKGFRQGLLATAFESFLSSST